MAAEALSALHLNNIYSRLKVNLWLSPSFFVGWTIDKAFAGHPFAATITVDRSKSPSTVRVDMSRYGRPAAPGTIDETNGKVHTGTVTFPDARAYKFWYHTSEGTIYWDHDKGHTGNIWRGKKPGELLPMLSKKMKPFLLK